MFSIYLLAQAISVPLYQGDDGLPAAVQVIGRPAAEDVLLSVAGQLEAALPWAARRPTAIAAFPSARAPLSRVVLLTTSIPTR